MLFYLQMIIEYVLVSIHRLITSIFSEVTKGNRDQDELVALLDLNSNRSSETNPGEKITHSEDQLIRDETPFYANQMEDPEVEAMYLDYINGLFQ